MKKQAWLLLIAAGIAGSAAAAASGSAPAYPTRPIRMVIPAPPGGSLDVVGRPVAASLGEALGQQVVVDNRAGAAGVIGSDLVAKAPPDGYTLLLTNLAFAITPSLLARMPYDAAKDFVAVSQLSKLPYLLVVSAGFPAGSLKELIAYAKDKPGALIYGSLGNGSGSHLTAVVFRSIAGIEMTHVPYKGFGPLAPDLLTGRVHMLFNTIPSVLPHVRTGKLRALAITQDTRSRLLPEVPTASEAGLPGFFVTTWHGVFSTAGTPRPVVEKLNATLVRIVNARDMQERLAGEGAEAVGSSPEQFARFFGSELARWSKVVKDAKVTVD